MKLKRESISERKYIGDGNETESLDRETHLPGFNMPLIINEEAKIPVSQFDSLRLSSNRKRMLSQLDINIKMNRLVDD